MRVSTNKQYNSYQSRIRMTQAAYFQAQQEVMTGKKQDLFKNDAAGASYVVRARDLQGALTQYKSNLRTAKDYVGNSEVALGDMHDLVKQAYSHALQGANSSTDQSARNSLAAQVGDIQKRLLDLVNAQGASSQYLFAGQNSGVKPFTSSPPTITYNGDPNAVTIEIGAGETMQVNASLSQAFIDVYDRLERTKNDLSTGDIAKLSDVDLSDLQNSMQILREQRGITGAKLQQITDMEGRHERRIDDLSQRISNVEDVDLSEAITRMQLAQTAYQGALQVTSQAQRLSLMDYLR
jgi:flagellar hook-associated protein 3 FlgL